MAVGSKVPRFQGSKISKLVSTITVACFVEEVLLLVASRKEIAISSSWVGHLTQLQPSLQVIERMVLE